MYDSDNDFFDYNLYNSESCLSKDDNISNAGGQFLEPELHWLTDAESELLGSSHNSSSLGRINVAVLEPIDYSTSTVWLKDLIGSSHFIPQCPDNVPNLNCGNFSPEDEDFEYVLFISNCCVANVYDNLPLALSCTTFQEKLLRRRGLESGLFCRCVLRLSHV